MTPGVLLAVDAGNSKTLAVAGDREGTILGTGRAGAGDIYAVGEEQGAQAVAEAITAALAAAGVTPPEVEVAALHLAGVDWPEDEAFWRARIRAELPGLGECAVRNDGCALLRAVDPRGYGVAVTVGTGPAIAARSTSGEAAMSFWCREPIGGAALAGRALDAVCLAAQGLAPGTALSAALPAAFGARDVAELLHTVTRREQAPPLAHGARTVLGCAADGDAVARGIVEADVAALVRYIGPTAERAGLRRGEAWGLTLGGSILSSEIPVYREALLARIAQELPEARATVTRMPPVLGALLDAHALDARTRHDPGRLERVHPRIASASLPEPVR